MSQRGVHGSNTSTKLQVPLNHGTVTKYEFSCKTRKNSTNAAARQSLNCINNKKNMAKNDFQYGGWNSYTLQCGTIMTLIYHQVTAPCNVPRGMWLWNVTVNSPSGSTLQCDTWLWDDMPLNSPKRPPYCNTTSGFDFNTSPQSTCHYAPVCKILSKSDQPRQKKSSCRFSRWRISAILDCSDPIMGSLKRPCTTSYRSLIDTIALNC